METLVDLLRAAAGRYGDRPAMISQVGLRSRTWTYRQLWSAANAVARDLRETHKLAPGTPVVLWEQNSPELVAALFGVMAARLVSVPVDPSASKDFVRRVLHATRAEIMISSLASGMDLPSIPAARLDFGAADPRPDPPSGEDVAEVVFTSGTTGTPKGVVLLHRNITANVEAARQLVPDRPFRLISLLPLSHMFEQTVGLFCALRTGSTVYYPTSRKAPVIAKAIRRNRISAIVAVPQVLEVMMRGIEEAAAQRGRRRQWGAANRIAPRLPLTARRVLFAGVHRELGGHLRYVFCGGARLPESLGAAWERLGVRVIEGYGATECAPIVAANTYRRRRLGTVGRPVPGVELDISAGGEILVRGPNLFAGYWEAPDATHRVVDEQGWFHTGDLGSKDPGGYLRITGRASERIILASGLNVYPEDVERELCEERELAACAVVPIPDASGNDRVHAAVIPAILDPPPDRAAIEAAIRRAAGRLAPHQRPTAWSVWGEPDFPRTNLAKVKRYVVAEAVRASRPSLSRPAAPPEGGGSVDPLRHLLARVSGVLPSLIRPESSLTLDLGLDSLGLLELAVAMEADFGVVVEDGDLTDIDTVEDLSRVIQRDAGRVPGEAHPVWPRAGWARLARDILQRLVLFPVLSLVARPYTVEGVEVFDRITGPVLLVANHSSHADTPSILRALPRRVRHRTAVAAAADYFYRSRFIGSVASLVLGTFPFSREGAVRSSFEHCGECCDDGWSVLIYPEGTRSLTGSPAPFRLGIGVLAAQLDVPVVPIGVAGTFGVWPKGRTFPTRGPVTVRIGEPVRVPAGADPAETAGRLERAVAVLV